MFLSCCGNNSFVDVALLLLKIANLSSVMIKTRDDGKKKLGGEGKKSETLEFLQKMMIIIHCYHQTISQTLFRSNFT